MIPISATMPIPSPLPAPGPRPARRRTPLALVALVLALGALATVAGCGASRTGASDRPTVVATTSILGDLVEQVAGDRVHVEVLMPPGADPHEFEASASQAARLRNADLIVADGLGLEERLESTIDAAERDGVAVLRVGEELDPLVDPDEDHPDPHVWLDPLRMARAAGIVADAITSATDIERRDLDAGVERYVAAADDAWRDAAAMIDTIPADQRLLVTNHDALQYFADRFGLEVVGTVIPGGSTLAEPSAQDVSRLVEVLRSSGIRAIFSETTSSSRFTETIAREVGGHLRVIELTTDSLGEPGSDTATYPDLIRTLARRIVDGLSGGPSSAGTGS